MILKQVMLGAIQCCGFQDCCERVKEMMVIIYCTFYPVASLTQAVRNFAKGLESWLQNSLDQIPKKMADVKVSVTLARNISIFRGTLVRFSS